MTFHQLDDVADALPVVRQHPANIPEPTELLLTLFSTLHVMLQSSLQLVTVNNQFPMSWNMSADRVVFCDDLSLTQRLVSFWFLINVFPFHILWPLAAFVVRAGLFTQLRMN